MLNMAEALRPFRNITTIESNQMGGVIQIAKPFLLTHVVLAPRYVRRHEDTVALDIWMGFGVLMSRTYMESSSMLACGSSLFLKPGAFLVAYTPRGIHKKRYPNGRFHQFEKFSIQGTVLSKDDL